MKYTAKYIFKNRAFVNIYIELVDDFLSLFVEYQMYLSSIFFSAEKHTEHCAMLCAPKTAQKWKTQMEREATKRENENVGNQQQKCQVRSTMSISRIHTEVETPAIA